MISTVTVEITAVYMHYGSHSSWLNPYYHSISPTTAGLSRLYSSYWHAIDMRRLETRLLLPVRFDPQPISSRGPCHLRWHVATTCAVPMRCVCVVFLWGECFLGMWGWGWGVLLNRYYDSAQWAKPDKRDIRAPSQYKDRLISVLRFLC